MELDIFFSALPQVAVVLSHGGHVRIISSRRPGDPPQNFILGSET